MKDLDLKTLSFDEIDEARSPRPAPAFDAVVASALSRRGFLRGVLAFGSGAAAMGMGALSGSTALAATSRFGFTPIGIATDFDVHVPEGYSWQAVAKWGQPLFSDTADVDPVTRGTGASQARAFGDNTDGMHLFSIGGKQVLAVNHEYIEDKVILGNRDRKSVV